MATETKSVSEPEAPRDSRRQFGNRGEDLATVFFVERGYKIVARNWSCRLGEIDLICERDGCVHFVEVKTRQSLEYGYPEEAVTAAKLRHIHRAVEAYCLALSQPPRDIQIDVLAILILPDAPVEYHYIENV